MSFTLFKNCIRLSNWNKACALFMYIYHNNNNSYKIKSLEFYLFDITRDYEDKSGCNFDREGYQNRKWETRSNEVFLFSCIGRERVEQTSIVEHKRSGLIVTLILHRNQTSASPPSFYVQTLYNIYMFSQLKIFDKICSFI